MTTNYVSVTETASLIRAALKRAFTGTKFTVRSKSYSGGASVTVSWTDGPVEPVVRQILDNFEGATFDPMQDLKSSRVTVFEGQRTHFGADYVFTSRNHSDALIQRAIDLVMKKYAANWKAAGIGAPSVDDFKEGRLHSVRDALRHHDYSQNLQRDIRDVLATLEGGPRA